MTHDPSSFKQVAVLTGLTALIGGAEISNVDAATVSEINTALNLSSVGSSTVSQNLSFKGFNAALGGLTGELTGVQLTLFSTVNTPFPSSATVSVELFGTFFPSSATSPNPLSGPPSGHVGFDFNFTNINGVSGTTTLADYMGSFSAVATLMGTGGSALFPVHWFGQTGGEGLTVTYTYIPTAAVPLPATLPLFAGGLAGLGFMTWRGRRKQTAKE